MRAGAGRLHPLIIGGKTTDHIVRLNLIRKVLDFIQLGGPDLTVGSTVFELAMAL